MSTEQACPVCGGGRDPKIAQLLTLLGPGAARRLGLYQVPDDLLLSVVIPVYNEARTVAELVRRVEAVPIRKEIILIDDGSSDGTWDVLQQLQREPDVRAVRHAVNRGKGAAIRTGFEHVRGTIAVIQDADLEYDPDEYPHLIQPIVEGVADVVFGSRFVSHEPHRVLYYWHSVGNWVLTSLSNIFTGLNLTDMETCYKVFRRSVLDDIAPTLKQNRFGIEPELTAKVARRRYRVYEVGIRYAGRTYEEGKKIGLRDAFQALWCILRYWKRD